jgi:hypothetical protein
MPNPGCVLDSVGEWIEIYNATASDIDLDGMELLDADFDNHVISGTVIVPAGGFVVLGTNDDPSQNGGIDVAYEYSNFFLGNSGDEVYLVDDDVLIDGFCYTANLENARQSLARDCPVAGGSCDKGTDSPGVTRTTDPSYNCCGDCDVGTPGSQNVLDSDGDGVPDCLDACTDTVACFETGGGVLVDLDGCSGEQLVELACPCDGEWNNHGRYVSCVTREANDQVRAGLLTHQERGAIMDERAHSSCGMN